MSEAVLDEKAERLARRKRRQERQAAAKGVYVGPSVQVVRTTAHGETVFFSVQNRRDEIQRYHVAGGFYEAEELALIARYFPIGGRFLDVGANVGNHSLYVAKFLRASLVVPFEPNPAASALLVNNLMLNRVDHVCDLQHLGLGLSDGSSLSAGLRVPAKNLGGARLIANGEGIPLVRGDSVLAGMTFDMIKIDAEGMELSVLAGLDGLIRATKPYIFVEVDSVNQAAFLEWVTDVDYRILETYKRYATNINYLIGTA